jgi:hypothetical protein
MNLAQRPLKDTAISTPEILALASASVDVSLTAVCRRNFQRT